jgi:hypothetical protein
MLFTLVHVVKYVSDLVKARESAYCYDIDLLGSLFLLAIVPTHTFYTSH